MTHARYPGLSPAIRSRQIEGVNGLSVHVLEAGFESPGRPCIMLLHGFPELAFSWRKIMVPLAEAGFHVVAPDMRGYGFTTGWDARYGGDVAAFRTLNVLKDTLALTYALGYRALACLVGHDFGMPIAAYGGLARGDVFRSVVLMSGPFAGPPHLPFDTAQTPRKGGTGTLFAPGLAAALAALDPPRQHYTDYFSGPAADLHMRHAPQGLEAFLRAYYHVKSADWPENRPHALAGATAAAMAVLPRYYVMDLDATMPETVAPFMPDAAAVARAAWLTPAELSVYAQTFARTGFQGGLNWYRCVTDPRIAAELQVFAGRTIDVPCLFVSGAQDWGVHQMPGGLARMQAQACTALAGVHLIEGAGHWVQQEQPEQVAALIRDFVAARA